MKTFMVNVAGNQYIVDESNIKEVRSINTNIGNREDTFFCYWRDSIYRPQFIFAVKYVDKDLIFGWSCCSEKDNFNKEIGRNIAINRLNNEPISIPLSGKLGECKTELSAIKTFLASQAYKYSSSGSYIDPSVAKYWLIEYSKKIKKNKR